LLLVAGPLLAGDKPKMNVATPELASAAVSERPTAPDYGLTSYSVIAKNSFAFQGDIPFSDEIADDGNANRYFSVAGSNLLITALTEIPSGAVINYFGLDYCSAASGSFEVKLFDESGGGFVIAGDVVFPAQGGCGYLYSPALNYSFPQNASHFLQIYVFQQGGVYDGSLKFRGVEVGYVRQVSPAPGSPTFTDVPTSDGGFQYIEALVASGITAGCGGGKYCPDQAVTRRQMAVFLAKALGLHWPN
jgi:S-layer homology domain